MLRKVMVTQYIRYSHTPATETAPAIPAHAAWEEVGEALFHGFGTDYEESDAGFGNFSIAIVEWPTGQVEMVRADKIRFLNPIVTGVDLPNGVDRTAVVHVSKEEGHVFVHDLRTQP